MQGLLSGLYHVCPNDGALRFDVLFVYVIVGLAMQKLYASRHGVSRPHVIFTLFAFILILTVTEWVGRSVLLDHNLSCQGVIIFSVQICSNERLNWFIFIVLQLVFMPLLGMQIYYNGHIEFSE